jgi:hypothetical protein
MRQVADAGRIRRFLGALADAGEATARVYFTGGATAVLLGWRSSSIDVDIKIVPGHDHLFRAIEADLYRFPAVDAGSFRRAMEEVFGRPPEGTRG